MSFFSIHAESVFQGAVEKRRNRAIFKFIRGLGGLEGG
jgi:hypothetical protein